MLKLSICAIARTGTVPVITDAHEFVVHWAHATAPVATLVAQWENQPLTLRP